MQGTSKTDLSHAGEAVFLVNLLMRSFTGESFWARGFYVSTVDLDEDGVKKYIREQEAEDSRLAPLVLVDDDTLPLGAHDEDRTDDGSVRYYAYDDLEIRSLTI